MVEFQTIIDWLVDVMNGDAEPFTCSGYPTPGPHEVVKYQLDFGRHYYGYACPICGFGSGGSIREEDYKRLEEARSSNQKGDKMTDKINPRDGALSICTYLLIERQKYVKEYNKYKDMTDMVTILHEWIEKHDKIQSSEQSMRKET